jgi:drug/metabolite transporter (DMT)-like permease
VNAILPVPLAAAAAIGWGSADFFGGDASRRDTSVFVVVAITEAIGALVTVPFLIARGLPPPDSPRLLLAALAGLAVTCELALIYRAISRGDAFITAPIGALGTAAAVGFGLLTEDPVTAAVLAGLLLALVGGGACAWTSPDTRRAGGSHWRTATTCAVAAAAVAVMLVSLGAAGRLDPYWATAVEHLSTSASAALAALAGSGGRLPGPLPAPRDLPKLGLVAFAGAGGDLAYTGASHGGALSTVSAVSSLYPLATIALGRLLQGQRATRVQLAGITLALGGAVILGSVS